MELPVPYRPAQQACRGPIACATGSRRTASRRRSRRPRRPPIACPRSRADTHRRNGHHRHMLEPPPPRAGTARTAGSPAPCPIAPDHGLPGRRARSHSGFTADAEKAVGFAGIEQADGRGRLEQRHGVHVVAAIQEYRSAVEGERDVPHWRGSATSGHTRMPAATRSPAGRGPGRPACVPMKNRRCAFRRRAMARSTGDCRTRLPISTAHTRHRAAFHSARAAIGSGPAAAKTRGPRASTAVESVLAASWPLDGELRG